MRWNPAAARPSELLGSLYAWHGEDAAALGALARAVAADGEGSVARYAPWLTWQRRLEDSPSPGIWHDLAQVYTQWLRRYPDRAETYARLALIYGQQLRDPTQARAVLLSGQEQGAMPASLLAYYLSHLE